MIRRIFVLLGIVCIFSGCATVDKITPDKKVVVVSAIDPTMQAQKIGLTIFNNKSWSEPNPGFDVNEVFLKSIKAGLNRDIKLVNGKDVGLIVKNTPNSGSLLSLALTSSEPDVAQKLAALGKDWQPDVILLIQGAQRQDWIAGTSAVLAGFGQYSRLGWGKMPTFAYGDFWLRVFDCKTGGFAGVIEASNAQMLPGIQWHDTTQDYTPEERRAISRGVKAVVERSALLFLSQTGLSNSKEDTSVQLTPQSFATDGNEIGLPADVSKTAAREAIVKALSYSDWNLTSNADDKLVGVHRNGNDETECAFSFTKHSVVLAPKGYHNQDDGKRLPTDYDDNIVAKLKKSIVTELLKAPSVDAATETTK
jgi:hypothetical protein